MGKLREHVLLWRAFKFVVVPAMIVALASSFFPFMQALVPVHEGDSCICIFMKNKDTGRGWYPILNMFSENSTAINLLVAINTTSFYAVNWIFLYVNIHAIYRIRKMTDKLDIRLELTWMVAIWSFFDLFQYIFYFVG